MITGERHAQPFGKLLQQHRQAAGLSQGELAERAGLSLRGIADLERGVRNTPYPSTVRRLAQALVLDDAQRAALLAARRPLTSGKGEGASPAARPAVSRGLTETPGLERDEQPSRGPVLPTLALATLSTDDGRPPLNGGPEGEHRPVTILSCQLADAAVVGERLGSEASLALMSHLVEQAVSEVQRYDGTLSAVSHAGFVALFGAPVAYEDHARRGVLAALGVQRRLQEPWAPQGRSREAAPVPFEVQLRMGLHTGLVAVGRIGSPYGPLITAPGEATEVAMVLEQGAAPGTIVVSEATARQVLGYIQLEPLEPMPMPGRSEPVGVARVIRVGPRRSPLEGVGLRALSPFVGRRRLVADLRELLEQVAQGHGQAVGLAGEPGMGKSRLLYEFRRSLADRRATYLEGRCLSYGGAIPYLPILDILRNNCGITDSDRPEVIVEKVRFGLREVELDPEEWGPYLLQLLGVKEGTEHLAMLSPAAVKTRTFETLRQMSLKGSRRRPLILAVEDLHWIDKTSEEYFDSLV
jgi:class 3 adenylate cyclase